MRGSKLVLPALLALLMLVPFAAAISHPHDAATMFTGTVGRLRGMGLAGECLFVLLVCLVALVGVVPGALLGIAAGAVYGVAAGFLTSAIGILAGAVLAFLLSRSILRPLIARLLRGRARLAMLDQLVARDRWKIVFLLRISPVMPFSLTSYALGLSGIGLADYFAGTLAAMPPLLGYVVIGALGTAGLAQRAAPIRMAMLGFGIAASLLLTIYLAGMLKKAVK